QLGTDPDTTIAHNSKTAKQIGKPKAAQNSNQNNTNHQQATKAWDSSEWKQQKQHFGIPKTAQTTTYQDGNRESKRRMAATIRNRSRPAAEARIQQQLRASQLKDRHNHSKEKQPNKINKRRAKRPCTSHKQHDPTEQMLSLLKLKKQKIQQ
ncbi:hypothetical protein U1Q18_036196, partial [Sarracenia purpurea var. burkii]